MGDMRLAALTVGLCVPLLASGCLGSSSPPSPHAQPDVSHGQRAGTIEGRVYTAACGGPAASSCVPVNFRGWLEFCGSMSESGPCPSARVGGGGRYRITLGAGRYALIPAPAAGNVVIVTPRWVSVGVGQVRTLTIRGGSSVK